MRYPKVEILPQRAAFSSERATSLNVLVRITPPAAERQAERPPLNLALVLDRSGSMSGPKLELAKEAACNLVSNLSSRDRVAVVAFDSTVDCIVESTLVTDKRALHGAIRSIDDAGQTALHQGWVDGGLQVARHLGREMTSRVILLTDGQANVGESDPGVLASHAGGLAERGISTTTMGIGDDYDERLLEGMARGGDGNFYHIESQAQFEQFFHLELNGLSRLMGSKVLLELSPRERVKIRVLNKLDRQSAPAASLPGRLAGWLSRKSSVEAPETLRLPNLIAEVPVEVSLVLELERPSRSGFQELLSLQLSWLDPERRSGELRSNLGLPAVSAAELANYPVDPTVSEKAILLEIAALKLETNECIGQRNFEQAAKLLEKATRLAREASPSAEISGELSDLKYIKAFLDSRQYASASKHAYYQSHQRSHSKTSYSSGRDTR